MKSVYKQLRNISNAYDRKGPKVFNIQRAFVSREDKDE